MIAKIKGTGSYVPENVLDNNALSKMMETNDEWIRERTGIARRHIAQGDDTVSMSTEAGKRALENAMARVVLPTPGTSSIKMCPPAKIAANTLYIQSSLPVTAFFTSSTTIFIDSFIFIFVAPFCIFMHLPIVYHIVQKNESVFMYSI